VLLLSSSACGLALLMHERVACARVIDALDPAPLDSPAERPKQTSAQLSPQRALASHLRNVLAAGQAWHACLRAQRGSNAAMHAMHVLLELACVQDSAQVHPNLRSNAVANLHLSSCLC
jgi:hypothetical protein